MDRDNWGVPHIRANSLEDLVEAQGYVTAQDRLWQMDVLRRFGAGELSEIFGPGTLAIDEQARRLGLRHVAERDAAVLSGDDRMVLEAYARGVNRFIEGHPHSLPIEFFLLRYKPRPWTPVDSMLIVGYMYESLTTVWPREINRDIISTRVDPDRVAEMFAEDSPDDRVVVGGEPQPEGKSDNRSRGRDRKEIFGCNESAAERPETAADDPASVASPTCGKKRREFSRPLPKNPARPSEAITGWWMARIPLRGNLYWPTIHISTWPCHPSGPSCI